MTTDRTVPCETELREALAALAHEQWSGWMRYLFSRANHRANGDAVLPWEWVERWQRQVETPYAELSEAEKDSDRKEADRVLALLDALRTPRGDEEKDHARIPSVSAEQQATAGKAVPDSTPKENTPCNGCGGPHPFDTSVPSVLWNAVIRKAGREIPDFLCATCIIRAFAHDGVSFTATLWGAGFTGLPIDVVVNGDAARVAEKIQAENNDLRFALREAERVCEELRERYEG